MENNLIVVGSGSDSIYIDGSVATLMTDSGSSTVFVGMNDTIDAGAGNDIVSVISGSNLYIAGGDGSDSIWSSSLNTSVTINGGAGNDSIYNRGKSVSIFGGDGSDSIENWYGSQVTIEGGIGNDSIYDYSGNRALIYGGVSDDFIVNGRIIYNGSTIVSNGDHVLINSDSGNDSIFNNGSYASVYGSVGNDSIQNEFGHYALLSGGEDKDTIHNESGNNVTIDGGSGDDWLTNQGLNASIYGGDGNDTIVNGYGSYSTNTKIYGGAGNDSIYNSSDGVTISGGTGIDTIYGDGSTEETFIHSADTDIIYGFGSGDTLSIESGTVTSSVVSGSDIILMTSNNGSIILKNTSRSNVSISGNVLTFGSVTLPTTDSTDTTSGSFISTGSGNDTIYVDGSIATLMTDSGSSTISVGSNDTIDAGAGNDVVRIISGSNLYIAGGDGSDSIGMAWSSSSLISNLTIDGGAGNDEIRDEGILTIVLGGDDADRIYNYGSYSTIDGGSGNDSIYNSNLYVSINGGTGNDSIENWSSHATIDGGVGDDTILNETTFVSVNGGSGNDLILNYYDGYIASGSYYATGIYSTINGGTGIDTIYGDGSTAETFIHSADTDIIYGFGSGDTLSIESGTVSSIDTLGSDVLITTSNGSIVLKNTSRSNVSSSGNVLTFGSATLPTDSIYASDGNDTIYVHGSIATVLSGSNSEVFGVGSNATINAGAGNDFISVYSSDNLYIVGGDGNDSIDNGYGSFVTIDGGAGNDSIWHGHGGRAYGAYASINGGSGDDTIRNWYGMYANIDGGAGNDTIYTDYDGNYSTINAGAGNDSIINVEGSYVSLNGGSGNDFIMNSYGGYDVTVGGGTGIDTIVGNVSLSETFVHTGGTDIIYGFDSTDVLSLESGSIISSVKSGSDTYIKTTTGSIVLMSGSFILNPSSTATNDVYSTDNDDLIFVNDSYATVGSWVIALGSDPTVNAGYGNDSIYNSDNNIVLYGNDGSDYIENIDGNLVSINGGIGQNTLVGANSESDLFVYDGGQDIIQNFNINDSIDFGSHTITSSIVSDDGITLTFDHKNSLNITIEGVGSENLQIENGVIIYQASEDVDYEYVPIFGSDIGSGSDLIDSNGSITSRTIIRMIGDEIISVESNFRTEDIKFAYYGSDGELYTQPNRDLNTRAFVALNTENLELVSNPYFNEDLNYGFRSEGSSDSWNVTLGAGNDKIHVEDITSGNFDGGSGADYFHVTVSLKSDVTLTGGSDTADFYYATSGVVSSKSDQARVTITDIDFDLGDVVLVDAGVANLTGDFFSQGKFYNFSNARQASTSGAIARNIFDATDIVENLDMDFSMAKFANRSEMPTGSDTSTINSTSVIWVNDESTVIELENQTDVVLVFTDSNNVGDEVYLGSQNFNDTIHAGFNDTIDGGGGNDQIYVGSSTNVIYSAGNDTIMNWNSSAIVDLNELDSMPSMSVSGENLLIGSMTIENVSGSDVRYRFDDEIGIMRVASNGTLKYGSEITYYAGSTLIIDTDENTVIDLSESMYENISMIDAGNGSGADRFIYDSGNVTIRNGDSTDVIDLSNYSFDEVSAQFTETGLILTMNNSSLNVEGTSLTTFYFSDGNRTADFTNQTF